jgi:hypothetical protein
VRREQSQLDDFAGVFADFDPVTELEGAPIRHAVPGDEIAYQRRRAE